MLVHVCIFHNKTGQFFQKETYFQEFQSACKQNPSCQLLEGVDRLNCIRECISPSCYIELYQVDKVYSYKAFVNFGLSNDSITCF